METKHKKCQQVGKWITPDKYGYSGKSYCTCRQIHCDCFWHECGEI